MKRAPDAVYQFYPETPDRAWVINRCSDWLKGALVFIEFFGEQVIQLDWHILKQQFTQVGIAESRVLVNIPHFSPVTSVNIFFKVKTLLVVHNITNPKN